MKILSVIMHLPFTPLQDSMQSAAIWRIDNIAKVLRSQGHEVNIIHYIRKSLCEPEDKERYNRGSLVATSIPPVKHLKMVLKDHYDLVYGNTHYGTFISLLGKYIQKSPLIFDMHGGIIEEFLFENGSNIYSKTSPRFILKSFIEFADIRYSDKIICVSKKLVEYLHNKKKVPLEKMAYVTNGVDLDFFKTVNEERISNLRQTLRLENKLVFAYIGSFQKWQGVENFIKSAQKADNSDTAFLVVGGEKKSKKNNVVFVSKVPRIQIPDYYSICDVLVLPRPSHPATEIAAPTKFAEYVAMGKPILTTNVGDAADFVREYKCGIVVEDNKVANLIEGINEFKGKSNDELERMGRNSRMLAENEFDWEKVGINLLNAINFV